MIRRKSSLPVTIIDFPLGRKPSRQFKFNIVAFKPPGKDESELANKNAIESNKSRNRSKSKKNFMKAQHNESI